MIITFKKLINILKNIGYELNENINSILDKYIDEYKYSDKILSIHFSEDTYIMDESKYKYYKSDKFNFLKKISEEIIIEDYYYYEEECWNERELELVTKCKCKRFLYKITDIDILIYQYYNGGRLGCLELYIKQIEEPV